MIDEFWRFYSQVRFAYQYHQIIRNRLIQKIKITSIVSYIVTMVSLAGWAMTGKAAAIWSVIILISQIANGLKDRLNWNEKKLMLSDYLLEMNSVILDLEKSWRNIVLGQLTEEKIMRRINDGDRQYKKLERHYILPCNLNESASAIKKADNIASAELKSLHGEGDDTYEQAADTIKPKANSNSEF